MNIIPDNAHRDELSAEDWAALNEEVTQYDVGIGEMYAAEESLEIIRSKKKI